MQIKKYSDTLLWFIDEAVELFLVSDNGTQASEEVLAIYLELSRASCFIREAHQLDKMVGLQILDCYLSLFTPDCHWILSHSIFPQRQCLRLYTNLAHSRKSLKCEGRVAKLFDVEFLEISQVSQRE